MLDCLYTVAELTERFSCSQTTILAWLHSGELQGINISRSKAKRKSWRISEAAVFQFEMTRTKQPKQSRKANKRKNNRNLIEYY